MLSLFTKPWLFVIKLGVDERQLYPSTRGQRLNIALGKLPEHRVAFSTTRSPRQTINPNSDKDQFPLILAQPQTIHLPDPQIPGNDDVQRTRIFSVIRALEDDDKPDILGFEIFMKARTGFCAFASASLFVRQVEKLGVTGKSNRFAVCRHGECPRVTWVRCNNAPCPATPDRSGSDMGTVPTLGRFRHWNPVGPLPSVVKVDEVVPNVCRVLIVSQGSAQQLGITSAMSQKKWRSVGLVPRKRSDWSL
ncbi:hypothetical protein Bbelb_436560 [Branchiostoma belcheri]|nr:hypothetical protein Bbelb_436560 [Branchiostoma belcheri]